MIVLEADTYWVVKVTKISSPGEKTWTFFYLFIHDTRGDVINNWYKVFTQ